MEIRRLAVVACTYAHFREWCHEHHVPSTDQRTVVFVRHTRDLFGPARPVPYTVVDWPSTGPDYVISALAAELHVSGRQVTDDELAQFIASIAIPASA